MENEGIPKQAIEQRAYQLYLDCGCDGGHDLEHWLAAEEELRQGRVRPRESVSVKSKSLVAGGSSARIPEN